MFLLLILLLIILGLLTYIFLLKKEILNITNEIQKIKQEDSNLLLHATVSMKEVTQLSTEINTLLSERKKQKIVYENHNQTFRKMIRNISHDLRTPLTSALGYIDLTLSMNLPQEASKNLVLVEGRLKRLEELMDTFFQFSKMMTTSPVLTSISLTSVLESCMAHYYEDYRKENRDIIYSNLIPKEKIETNRNMLTRVFDNLIGNALQHSQGNLEIEVCKKEKIRITFTNLLLDLNLDIEHMFDEFYTVDVARTKGNTGLGLAIAKEFTEKLGGQIWATQKKNQLEIIVEFPINEIISKE